MAIPTHDVTVACGYEQSSRGQQRTAGLNPHWLTVSAPDTVHPLAYLSR